MKKEAIIAKLWEREEFSFELFGFQIKVEFSPVPTEKKLPLDRYMTLYLQDDQVKGRDYLEYQQYDFQDSWANAEGLYCMLIDYTGYLFEAYSKTKAKEVFEHE